jgi:5-methylcytosine-specific restriction endonuclease McrA
MQAEAIKYPWAEELEKTVVNSLVTSFGLDFLLFKDKEGGDVDTIYNVRKDIWGTDQEKQQYTERQVYSGKDYHSHTNYIDTGRRDKALQQEGKLHDTYRNRIMEHDKQRNLDHVISAKEIHDDAGRFLTGLSGVELANQNSNLQTTSESINKSKNSTPIDEYLNRLPNLINGHRETLAKDQNRLADMPRDTKEQQHKARELEDKIRKNDEKIKQLESVDHEEMRKRDAEARINYNQQINFEYYTGSKFLKQTAKASSLAGLKMGTRQMLGLVLAEVWFELREQIPMIFEKNKKNFEFGQFIEGIKDTLQGIWRRIQARFQDFLISFKDGVFAGVLGSATTTLFNIFATTQKTSIKIIREMWGHLVKAIKLMIFNPDRLSLVELCKAVVSVLSVGVATLVGSAAYAELLPLCSFPFGSELAAFAGALVTGVITLGLNYFLLYSSMAQKLWNYVGSIMPHAATVEKFQLINSELDRYLVELGRLEFNLDADEFATFSNELIACNDEIQKGMLLKEEVAKREIELPFEMGNAESTRKWLTSLIK